MWVGYGRVSASAAADFDQGLGQVVHQVDRMGTSLDETGSYVETELSNVDVRRIADIEQLINEWNPRYRSATLAYARFRASIDAAEALAEQYFEAQRDLTSRYNNPSRRAQAEESDAAEYARFQEWKDNANSKLELGLAILRRMSDMDTDLQKSLLTSELTIEFSQFSTVPDEILALSRELAQFQIASRNVREAIGTGF